MRETALGHILKYDVAATASADRVLARDCRTQIGRPQQGWDVALICVRQYGCRSGRVVRQCAGKQMRIPPFQVAPFLKPAQRMSEGQTGHVCGTHGAHPRDGRNPNVDASRQNSFIFTTCQDGITYSNASVFFRIQQHKPTCPQICSIHRLRSFYVMVFRCKQPKCTGNPGKRLHNLISSDLINALHCNVK